MNNLGHKKFPPESLLKLYKLASFTLPDHQYTPAQLTQLGFFFCIPLDVGLELGKPVFLPALRHARVTTAKMSMPETPMYKDHSPESR